MTREPPSTERVRPSGAFQDPLIDKSIYLAALDEERALRVKQSARLMTLKKRQILFHKGDRAEAFFLVKRGAIKLFRASPHGEEKVINVVKPGGSFATAVIFRGNRQYPVTAEAVSPSQVWSVASAVYLEVLRESPDACFQIMADLSRRLHCLVGQIDGLCLKDSASRVVQYLVNLLPESTPMAEDPADDFFDQAVELRLGAPKHVIASHLSIQPETLSRVFRDLKERGLIVMEGDRVRIPNLSELQAEVMGCGGTL